MEEGDLLAADEAEEGEEGMEEFEEEELQEVPLPEIEEEEELREVPLPVATLKRAQPVNTGAKKKRKIVHRSSRGRTKDAETKTITLSRMKASASLDLSDPSQLTMKEIIRRAEAIERAKAREEAAKKAEEKAEKKKSSSSTSRASATERPAAQNTPAPSVIAPQVQIVNGRIVINQQSLVVAAQASTREDTDTYRRVEEDRPKLNYNSYSNRTPVERWKAEDTALFYKALQQFGTDFELIQNLFPGRTRRQVKAKFKNEEKLNPIRLADALGHKTQDQSHHYRAIIEMLKTEKAEVENEDDILLNNLLLPRPVPNEAAAAVDTEQAKPDEDEAVKPDDDDDDDANIDPPIFAAAEVDDPPASDDPPAPEEAPALEEAPSGSSNPPANPLGSYGKVAANPLGSYGKVATNPLGSYGKVATNPLGSYAKNPLGMYK